MAPAICVNDTSNNSGGFRKGSGGAFNNVCSNDCGGWTSTSFTGYPAGLDGHLYSAPTNYSGASWAEWQPALPAAGFYEIWVYVPSNGATTYQAQYAINSGTGTSFAYVDQGGLNDQWVSIGRYQFAGTTGYVDVLDFTPDTVQRLIGADAIKFVPLSRYVNFAPQVRAGGNWNGSVLVHNNTASSGNIYITVSNLDGTYGCGQALPIGPQENWYIDGTCIGSASSVVVGSDVDVSAEVENLHLSGAGTADVATNYTGISPAGVGGNSDWGQAATTLYAPTVKYSLGGRTTDLVVMNAGNATTNVTATFYNANGSQYQSPVTCSNLAPNARCTISPTGTTGTLISAIITAGQPLAGVAFEYDSSLSQVNTYNLLAGNATNWYVPTYKKNSTPSIPQSTGLLIQNTSSTTASNVTVTYYDGSTTYSSGAHTIPAHGYYLFYQESILPKPPLAFVGSARVVSTQPVVVGEVSEGGTVRKMASSAAAQATTLIYVPHACNNCTIWGQSFTSGIRIQNTGTSAANVTITYYNGAGTQVGTETINGLGSYVGQNVASIPAGLDGSAKITANQPIVAIVNLANSNTSLDLAMTYNPPNR